MPTLTCSPGLPASPGGPAGPGRPWGGRRGAMSHHGGTREMSPAPCVLCPPGGEGDTAHLEARSTSGTLFTSFSSGTLGGTGQAWSGGGRWLPSPLSGGRVWPWAAAGWGILTAGPGGPWAPVSPSLPAAPWGGGRGGCSERPPHGSVSPPGLGVGLDTATGSFEGRETNYFGT